MTIFPSELLVAPMKELNWGSYMRDKNGKGKEDIFRDHMKGLKIEGEV